jgi:hypothetical protein
MVIVSPDEVRDTLVLVMSTTALSPPPLETIWFPDATDHNFEGIVFIFDIQLCGVKVLPPIKNGQGQVISLGVWGQKPPKLSTF